MGVKRLQTRLINSISATVCALLVRDVFGYSGQKFAFQGPGLRPRLRSVDGSFIEIDVRQIMAGD